MHKLTQSMMDRAMKNPKTQLGVGFGGDAPSKKPMAKPVVKSKVLNNALIKAKK